VTTRLLISIAWVTVLVATPTAVPGGARQDGAADLWGAVSGLFDESGSVPTHLS
jgi:hypothetical protein